MKKKLLSILLVLSLMLALVPAAFAAGDVSAELGSDGTTLTFSGRGTATADCWDGDWTAVTHIALGFNISGIAEDVLARCVNLVSFETVKGSWYFQTYNGGLISEDSKQMLAAPNRCTVYEIPDLVQTVKPSGIRGGVKQHTCLRCGAPGVEFLMPEILAYEQFGDIDPEDWSYEGIQFCVMTGLMSGTSDTTFSPNGVTTRAQVVQVLYNLMEEPEVSGTTPFTDLTADWYQDAVLWAYQTGVVVGTSDTTFSPEAPVTREQIAVILMEFASKVLQIESGETPADLSAYPDGGSVSDWARTAMADAVALGILSGAQDSNGTLWLQPQAGATRAEVATILEGFCVVIVYAQ